MLCPVPGCGGYNPSCSCCGNSQRSRQSLDLYPPIINDRTLSPVHHSQKHGVHADIGFGGPEKIHVPFVGQTTLDTLRIGGRPSYENDKRLADLGGTFKPF